MDINIHRVDKVEEHDWKGLTTGHDIKQIEIYHDGIWSHIHLFRDKKEDTKLHHDWECRVCGTINEFGLSKCTKCGAEEDECN